MSCNSYEWRAYALGELDPAARRQAEVARGGLRVPAATNCGDSRADTRCAVHSARRRNAEADRFRFGQGIRAALVECFFAAFFRCGGLGCSGHPGARVISGPLTGASEHRCSAIERSVDGQVNLVSDDREPSRTESESGKLRKWPTLLARHREARRGSAPRRYHRSPKRISTCRRNRI